MTRIISVLPALSAAVSLFAAPLSDPIEKKYNQDLKVVHFLPGGLRGIYDKGQKVSFSMVLDPQANGTAEVEIEVLDFYKNRLETIKMTRPATAGKRITLAIPVKPPAIFGHFVLNANVRLNGKICVSSQSAFVVLPPPPEKPDPFFILDGRNPHYIFDQRAMYKRVGVDAISLHLLRSFPKDPAIAYRAYFNKPGKVKFSHVIGQLSLSEDRSEKAPQELRKAGFYPYSKEYYLKEDELVRACALMGKGVIKEWWLSQEVDGNMTILPPSSVMTDHIIRVQRISKILREVDPKAKIVVINSCGDDFFFGKFRIVRMLLKETAKYVDYFGIDAYSGTWNGLLSDLEPPEKDGKLKAILQESSKVAKEFLLPANIIQAERGYFIPYMSALNSPRAMELMNLNARSIIIARGIKEVLSYSRHGACSWYQPYNMKQAKRSPEKATDGGLWRSVYDAFGNFALQPRPSIPAFATLIRLLSYVTEPEEVQVTKEIYSYTFKRPNGKRLAAIWSIGKDTRATFVLPSDAVYHDMMGNSTALKKGKQTLTITQTPCFVELAADQTTARNMLKQAYFPDIKTFDGIAKSVSFDAYDLHLVNLSNRALKLRVTAGKGLNAPSEISLELGKSKKVRLTGKPSKITLDDGSRKLELSVPDQPAIPVPRGTRPKVLVKLKYPDHIQPLAALRAERNLFKGDGTDISADFAASWDQKYLYLEFTVLDKIHLQRQSGSSIWRDDSIQLGIDIGNNALPERIGSRSGYSQDDYMFGLALCKNGPITYAWYNGKRASGLCDFKTVITRNGNQTIYRTAVPWSALGGIKPAPGTVFGFSFLVMDNNDPAFRNAPYWLEWTGGITGKQDPSLFKTLILQ